MRLLRSNASTIPVLLDTTSWSIVRRKASRHGTAPRICAGLTTRIGGVSWSVQAGAGSCIFMHVWQGPSAPTVGCTALAIRPLVELMSWLAPLRTPVLVQLPRSVYERVRVEWDLP